MALCHYCRKAPGVTRDHIVPKALGGPNVFWNYVKACSACNNKKGSDWPTCRCSKCKEAVWRFKLRQAGILYD